MRPITSASDDTSLRRFRWLKRVWLDIEAGEYGARGDAVKRPTRERGR